MNTLENHEQKFKQDKNNPFISRMANIIAESNPQDLVNLIDMIEKDKNHATLTEFQFTLLGAYIYMLGIETFNQPYLNKRSMVSVIERIEKYEIIPEAYRMVIDIILAMKEYHVDITSIKDSIKEKITNPVIFKAKESVEFNNMIIAIKKVFKHSLIPINFVCNANDILKKNVKMTYNDLITINNIINEECHYVGYHAKNSLLKLNTNPVFQKLISEAVQYHEDGKYSMLHFDHILTMMEYSVRASMDDLYDGITRTLSDESYQLLIDAFTENKKAEDAKKLVSAEKTETSVSAGPVNDLSDVEKQQLIQSNPVETIFVSLDEIMKHKIETSEDVIEALTKLIESHEDKNVQDLYGYMRKAVSTINTSNVLETRKGIDLTVVAEMLKAKFEDKKQTYKDLAEFVCKPIESNISNRIKTYVIDCIKSLVLETTDQKNYLLSVMIEPKIDTYNQLQQIVGLIETCRIDGADMLSYVTLYDYLKFNDDIVEIFEKSRDLEKEEITLSMLGLFNNWFNKLVQPSIDVKKTIDEVLDETEKPITGADEEL